MTILSKTDIVGLLGGFYPTLTADDCADLRETFDALHAALEVWVDWVEAVNGELPNALVRGQWIEQELVDKAIELTKATGVG